VKNAGWPVNWPSSEAALAVHADDLAALLLGHHALADQVKVVVAVTLVEKDLAAPDRAPVTVCRD
jgi:hypothetical protein